MQGPTYILLNQNHKEKPSTKSLYAYLLKAGKTRFLLILKL